MVDIHRPPLTTRGLAGMRHFAMSCAGRIEISTGGLIDYIDEIAELRTCLLGTLTPAWRDCARQVRAVTHLRKVLGRKSADQAMAAHGLPTDPPDPLPASDESALQPTAKGAGC